MYSSYFSFQMTIENNYAIAIARPCASFSANEEKKPKPIAICTHHFFSALGKLQVIYRNSDNFTVLIFPVVIS